MLTLKWRCATLKTVGLMSCNVDSSFFQRRLLTLYQRCTTLNIPRRIVSFSTSDQRYFKVDPQRWLVLFRIELCIDIYRKPLV